MKSNFNFSYLSQQKNVCSKKMHVRNESGRDMGANPEWHLEFVLMLK